MLKKLVKLPNIVTQYSKVKTLTQDILWTYWYSIVVVCKLEAVIS